MALLKSIRQDDGVTTAYHRILFIQHMVNSHNSIAVISYTDEDARNGEINGTVAHPYQKSITYEVSYDPTMTIESAYELLKTMPAFEGAVDI